MPKRGSDWVSFLRALVILQRLVQSPASGDELIAAVRAIVGDDAYPAEKSAFQAAFKHDREHLRDRLQADFVFDPVERKYNLTDPGPFWRLALTENSLKGLGILARDFGNGLGERVHIRALLDELLKRLSPETRRLLERQPETLSMGVRQFVDKGQIPFRVWETVRKSVESRRELSFKYLSPRYNDGNAVYFEIAPIQLKYQEGHWYLRGWVLERRPLEFTHLEPEYVRFRVTYIQDDEYLKTWPKVFPERFRTPPRFEIHYLLKPEIGRGEISHHFNELSIERLDDGSAEIRGFHDDVWEAGRLLLAYGEGCIVLGGNELRREMERRVRGMAQNYGFYSD
jgi:predicted DNA-binding transcriptional regulator YafY